MDYLANQPSPKRYNCTIKHANLFQTPAKNHLEDDGVSIFDVCPRSRSVARHLSLPAILSITLLGAPGLHAESATALDNVDIYAKKKTKQPDIAIYNRPATQIAQSVAYFDGKTAAQTGSDRLEDFATLTPSVQLVDGNGAGSSVNIRGFRASQATIDGLPDVQGFYLRDPATLESIAIVKGRDATLSGFGTAGGTLHYTSKKPSYQRERTFKIETGDPSLARGQLDITDTLGSDNDSALAGRVVLSGQQAQTGYAHVGDDRFTLMPSLRWHDDKQSVDVGMEYGWQNRESDDTTVLYNGKPLYNVAYVDPRANAERRVSRLTVDYNRHLNTHWDAQLQAAHIEGKRHETQSGLAFPATADETLWYSYYRRLDQRQQQTTLKAELQHQTQNQRFKHQTQMGVYNQHQRSHYTATSSVGDGIIDIQHPVFDYPLPDDNTLEPLKFRNTTPERALYVQHQTNTQDGKWGISVGVRKTHATADGSTPELSQRYADTRKTSRSVGVTWQARPHWQWFASHNEAFNPNTGFDRNGKLFAPETSVQHETGVRYQRTRDDGQNVQASLSTYRIQRDNVTTTDPLDDNYSVLAGKIQSDGVEASVNYPLTHQTTVTAVYAYGDAKITRSNSGLGGNQLSNQPRHSGAVQVAYRPNHATELSVTAQHIGKRFGDNANSFTVDGYTRWDAAAEWQTSKKTKLTAGVRNLFNEDYVAGASSQSALTQGRKRSATVGWEVNF